jgi:uncharacterized membrane protein
MWLNKDITRFGWIIAGVILVVSGIRHALTRELYGRVRISGAPPLLVGRPVLFAGLAELAIGILLLAWFIRKR